MDEVIDMNEALLVIGIAAGTLCLFFIMMVCFLSPHCFLNKCLPCAPRYDECDEYVHTDKSKLVESQKGVRKSERMSLQSIQEVFHDGGKLESAPDEGIYESSLEEKPEKRKEKQSLMATQAKTLKQYLSFEASPGAHQGSSGGQSASDESSGESSLLYVPLKKSSVEFTMLWDKDSHVLKVEIAKLKCNFSKFAKVSDDVTMKLQLAQSGSAMQNIFGIFQKEEDLKKNLVKEVQTSIKKRKKEILFNEKTEMIIANDILEDYSLRLVICTVSSTADKDNKMENMGEAFIPLKSLESSTSYSTTMVLQPLPKEAKGEVLVSLSYLPTSEKLSVVIMQVNNVTSCSKKGDSELFVKMSLVNRGRTLQKKRTEAHTSHDHLQFNETHIFDLPFKHIDKTSLVLSLKETLKGKWIAGDDATIGKCILNARSEDLNASGHWKEMFLNSRNPVVKWQFFR